MTHNEITAQDLEEMAQELSGDQQVVLEFLTRKTQELAPAGSPEEALMNHPVLMTLAEVAAEMDLADELVLDAVVQGQTR